MGSVSFPLLILNTKELKLFEKRFKVRGKKEIEIMDCVRGLIIKVETLN